MGNPLDANTIEALLQQDAPRVYDIPEQKGPLRQYDREMRCGSRRCGSPTHFKVQGMPFCMIHALRWLNEMLIERGVDQ